MSGGETRPGLYPETEPYDHGLLETGDGHQIYWELCGNPGGKPAVVLHGGPGSGCTPWWRRLFDPEVYRIVLFDQRGCGGSAPHAGAPTVDLTSNTTHHLLTDIESLRRRLAIKRWLVLGGSWGSTLALAYGQKHPERITEMVLFSVATTTRREVEWVTRDVGRLFPDAWMRFRAGVPESERDGSLVDAYNRLLHHPDPAVRGKAARDWCDWEDAHVRTRPSQAPNPRYDDPVFRRCFARLVTHYWRHAAWLADGVLLREAGRLAGNPGRPRPRPAGCELAAGRPMGPRPIVARERARGRRGRWARRRARDGSRHRLGHGSVHAMSRATPGGAGRPGERRADPCLSGAGPARAGSAPCRRGARPPGAGSRAPRRARGS